MISPTFDSEEFFRRVCEYDLAKLLKAADEECRQVENLSRGRGGPRAREQGSMEYAALLKEFLFFLHYRKRPGAVSSADFMLFKPVCENLVAKGELQPNVLELFGSVVA